MDPAGLSGGILPPHTAKPALMKPSYQISISKSGTKIVHIDKYSLAKNHITFLFGESGIGKSILNKAIYGLIDPHQLEVIINGKSYAQYLEEDAPAIGDDGFFVFQEPSSHLNPLMRLTDQISEGDLSQAPGEAETLKHLWDIADAKRLKPLLSVYPKPHRPSGGEKQRVLLTMAFKKLNLMQKQNKGGLFVFDEPTGSLDNHFRNLFLQLLFDKFRKSPFTAVVITHDYSIISEIYRNHADLKKAIRFTELKAGKGGLFLEEFAAEGFLRWLKAEKDARFVLPKDSKPLLSFNSGYRVFGRKMKISPQQNSTAGKTLTLRRGEMVYLKAASGVGKTTLAKILMGLMPAEKFEAQLCGHRLNQQTRQGYWRRHIWGKHAGMVFQHADEALNLRAKVKDIFGGLPLKKKIRPDMIRRQLKSLFDMQIEESFLNRPVQYLSGGQKQRLNLLRTLILDTDIIILDEPLNGLDFESIQRVVQLLQDKQEEGKAILMISHNEDIFDAIIAPESIYYLSIAK